MLFVSAYNWVLKNVNLIKGVKRLSLPYPSPACVLYLYVFSKRIIFFMPHCGLRTIWIEDDPEWGGITSATVRTVNGVCVHPLIQHDCPIMLLFEGNIQTQAPLWSLISELNSGDLIAQWERKTLHRIVWLYSMWPCPSCSIHLHMFGCHNCTFA